MEGPASAGLSVLKPAMRVVAGPSLEFRNAFRVAALDVWSPHQAWTQLSWTQSGEFIWPIDI
jgi:hypothetical protein